MAQQTFNNGFHNGARESVRSASSGVKAAEFNSSAATSLNLLPANPDPCPSVAPALLAHVVVAASRNCLNTLAMLRQFAQTAPPLEATLAGLYRPGSPRAAQGLKALAASLLYAQELDAASKQRFLTRLGLHLVAVEPDSSIDLASARGLLALSAVPGTGLVKNLAAQALACDRAYDAEFQSLMVAVAVMAGQLVKVQQPADTVSLRARLGYAGPPLRRSATRRPRAAVRAAKRVLVAVH